MRPGECIRMAVEGLEARHLLAAITVTTTGDDLTPNDGTVSLRTGQSRERGDLLLVRFDRHTALPRLDRFAVSEILARWLRLSGRSSVPMPVCRPGGRSTNGSMFACPGRSRRSRAWRAAFRLDRGYGVRC